MAEVKEWGLDREDLLQIYRNLLLTRGVEERGHMHPWRIVELGAERQILNKYSTDNKFDAAGQHVYPGFIDAHCHFFGYGLNKQKIDLIGTKSWDEVIQKLIRYAEEHPEKKWLIGR